MDQQSPSIHVLIVDDHAAVRHGLATLLGNEPDIQVIGEADDGRAAVRLVGELWPDVVLMDVRMPIVDGVEATRRIVRAWPGVRVVGMSMDGELAARRMLTAGAIAHLPKGSDVRALLDVIRGHRPPPPTAKEKP